MERKEATYKALEMAGVSNPEIVLMSKFSPVPYAKRLGETTKFLYDKYKRFWRYDLLNGIWKEDADIFIKNRLRQEVFGEELQKKNYTDEVVSYIRDMSYNPDKSVVLDENIIAFNNCLYNLVDDKFIEFSAEYFVTSKLPINIDSTFSSDCSVIDSFFSDIVGEEYKTILYELCAYCLYRSYPYQKLFFLIGGGKNGKSTFLELLRTFLGNDNVSSVSPHDICGGNRFALGNMWNKHANISSDISYELLRDVNKIKEITGGDTVNIERKFKEGFPEKIFAKQIFSTNQLPMVNDKTGAWYRRPYLIYFPRSFENPDREILKKLTTPLQLNGLAWQCIKYLKGIKERGFSFHFDIDEEKLGQTYEDLSNPLSKFIRENCIVDEGDQDAYIWKFEFREKFEQWLKDNKFRTWSETELGIEMKKKFTDRQRPYRVFGGMDKMYRSWEGLKWGMKSIKQGLTGSHPFITTLYIHKSSRNTPVNLLIPVIDVNNSVNANFQEQI